MGHPASPAPTADASLHDLAVLTFLSAAQLDQIGELLDAALGPDPTA
jgi:hypothetical protein